MKNIEISENIMMSRYGSAGWLASNMSSYVGRWGTLEMIPELLLHTHVIFVIGHYYSYPFVALKVVIYVLNAIGRSLGEIM